MAKFLGFFLFNFIIKPYIDTSGSMNISDKNSGKKVYEIEKEIARNLTQSIYSMLHTVSLDNPVIRFGLAQYGSYKVF